MDQILTLTITTHHLLPVNLQNLLTDRFDQHLVLSPEGEMLTSIILLERIQLVFVTFPDLDPDHIVASHIMPVPGVFDRDKFHLVILAFNNIR